MAKREKKLGGVLGPRYAQRRKDIIRLLKEGKTQKEIAKALGVSAGTVYRSIHKFDIPPSKNFRKERRDAILTEDYLLETYAQGTPITMIERETGILSPYISDRIKELGIIKRKKRYISTATREKLSVSVSIGKRNKGLVSPVDQFTMQGKKIASYPSIVQAAKANNLSQRGICQCCRGVVSRCGGFIWKYK